MLAFNSKSRKSRQTLLEEMLVIASSVFPGQESPATNGVNPSVPVSQLVVNYKIDLPSTVRV